MDDRITEAATPGPVELPNPEATITLEQYLERENGEPDR